VGQSDSLCAVDALLRYMHGGWPDETDEELNLRYHQRHRRHQQSTEAGAGAARKGKMGSRDNRQRNQKRKRVRQGRGGMIKREEGIKKHAEGEGKEEATREVRIGSMRKWACLKTHCLRQARFRDVGRAPSGRCCGRQRATLASRKG
jgi:hypothetical protein